MTRVLVTGAGSGLGNNVIRSLRAAEHVSTTSGSNTVLPSAGVDDTPLGWLPPPK